MGSVGGGRGEMSELKKVAPRGVERGLASCHVCEKVTSIAEGKCPRCGTRLHMRKPDSITRTIAFLIGGAALYVPANMLPILSTRELGVMTDSTIVEGMIQFWNAGSYPIAIVIFTASLFIPILKIIALLWLCAAAKGWVPHTAKVLGRVYWVTELLGRWSMVDIFVVAILVSMVQLGNYMRVTPGPGALAFAGVVLLTMFSAMSFDPKLLWDRLAQEADLEKKNSRSE
jgi:paraquat-inducible protein A